MKFDHKRRMERIFDQGWNKGNFDGMEDLISDNATFHIRNQSIPTNVDDLKHIVAQWHSAFPDFKFSIEDMAAEIQAGKDYTKRAEEAEEYGDKGLVVQLEDMVRDEMGHSEETQRILKDWPL